MDRRTAIASLVRHSAEPRRRGVQGLYLFGSVARGQAGAESDIDLFYDYRHDGHFSLFDILDVQEFVQGILGRKADVVPRNCLHRRIRARAEAEAIQVF